MDLSQICDKISAFLIMDFELQPEIYREITNAEDLEKPILPEDMHGELKM